ncbi:hypothetical protein [Gilvibacter sp.]|uniref:hypothetical protein n=1 Tax=Gilvibacter sp. TaxID=2729997 RepID=UPI0035BE68CC
MKLTLHISLIAVALCFVTSCSSDPCDDGYSPVEDNGTTICLPDYVVGLERNMTSKTKFFHRQHGVIIYDNGTWTNQFGENITTLLKAQ